LGFVRRKILKLACKIFNEKFEEQTESLFAIKYGIKNKKIDFVKIRIDYFLVRRLP